MDACYHHTQASTRHGIPDDVAQEFKAVDRDGDGWVTALDCAGASPIPPFLPNALILLGLKMK